MSKRIANYYVISHNSSGKCNLINTNIEKLDTLVVLECCSRLIATMILKKITNELINKEHDIEIIHDPIDKNIISGIIDLDCNIGIFSKEIIEDNTKKYIAVSFNCSFISENNDINAIQNKINALYNVSYKYFKQAKDIHDDWESVYIESIDFLKADEITQYTIESIFGDIQLDKKARIRERFFGAISANGATNYVEEIISNKETRYFVKGRPGTSKSTMLKKIAKAAEDKGINVDLYYCASDINSIDMLVFEELDVCIFDSTFPHEFFPTRDDDIIIDMYAELLPENFDEDNDDKLEKIKNKYSLSMTKSISVLKDIIKLYDDLETEYINTIDFDMLANIYEEIKQIINIKDVKN